MVVSHLSLLFAVHECQLTVGSKVDRARFAGDCRVFEFSLDKIESQMDTFIGWSSDLRRLGLIQVRHTV